MAQIDVPGTGNDEKDTANDPGTDDKKVGQTGKDELDGPNNESNSDLTE
jgi:hypothetical protein